MADHEEIVQKAVVLPKGDLKEVARQINNQWEKGRWVQHLLQDDDGILVVFQWVESTRCPKCGFSHGWNKVTCTAREAEVPSEFFSQAFHENRTSGN